MKGSFISHRTPSSSRKETRQASIYPKTFEKVLTMKLSADNQKRVELCMRHSGRSLDDEVNRIVGLGLMFDPPERWNGAAESGKATEVVRDGQH